MSWRDKAGEAKKLFADSLAIFANAEASAEDKEKAGRMFEDGKAVKAEAEKMQGLELAAVELDELTKGAPDPKQGPRPGQFKSFGEVLQAIHRTSFGGQRDPRLQVWDGADEPATSGGKGWVESTKDLVESVGASGGFLVPTEFDPTLKMLEPAASIVRQRATIIPMRRRAIQIPVLDQTTTTSGVPHWFGGVYSKWTEEAASKPEYQPAFRQVELVAHKLVNYTEASDELLADSAVSLESLLAALFRGSMSWYTENAFVQGTGAGQPLGVVNAGATIVVARQAQLTFGLDDLVNMLEHFMGTNPVWMITQQGLSNLLLLNGPATNPSYVFMPSARDSVPSTLFGYPIFFSEHCSALGTQGDVILADWSKYLIGDRQGVTIDSSKHYRFQYDLTAWRAVSRVDGQPWLSTWLTYSDGTTTVSPFVVLGDKST